MQLHENKDTTIRGTSSGSSKKRKRRRVRTEAKYRVRRLCLLLAALLLIWGIGAGITSLVRGGGLGSVLPASGSGRGDNTKVGVGMTVMLDAGHGGDDSGTSLEDLKESDINLSITLKLKALLEKHGFKVEMIRETADENPTLKERVAMANESKADLFISIHQNALEGDTSIHGIETFCNEDSLPLGELIQQHIIAATGAEDRGATTGTYLYVVERTEMTACLIETGFLTMEKERQLLASDAYQDKLASGIVDGICAYVTGNASKS